MHRYLRALILVAALVTTGPRLAGAASIGDFFGVYVGNSEVVADGTVIEHRDLDLEIADTGGDGFVVRLISVATVDGRRDVPGVERWYRELKFRRDGDGWAIDMRTSLFAERRHISVEEGDEVLRARIDGESLIVSSEFIQASGERVDQVFDFHLTDSGLEAHYVREVGGNLDRETLGRLIRVD